MDLVFQLISVVAAVISIVLLIISVRAMRKESRTSLFAPLSGMFSSLLMTSLFIVVAGVPINWIVAALLLAFGFFVGLVEGFFTRLYYRGNLLMLKRSAIYFVLWGLAYLLTLLLAQTKSSVLTAGGILAMILGLGIALGSNLNLLFRQTILRPSPAPAVMSPLAALTPSSDLSRDRTGRVKPASPPTDLPG